MNACEDLNLRVCDFCFGSEADDIINGTATDLREIIARSDGLWMCAECKRQTARDTQPDLDGAD